MARWILANQSRDDVLRILQKVEHFIALPGIEQARRLDAGDEIARHVLGGTIGPLETRRTVTVARL